MDESTGPKPPARIRQGTRAGGAPGVNWTLAASLARDGDTDATIARTLGVSEEAVRKRRHAEGWTTTQDPAEPSIRDLAAAACAAALGSANGYTEDQLTLVLTSLTAGVNLHLAARAAGTTADALEAAAKQDPQLARTLSIAAARASTSKIARINAAGERGDWKADAYLLERNPDTREQFAGQATSGKGGVTVILNFDRNQPQPGVTIEGDSEAL